MGWTFKTIVQGSSIPQLLIPKLIALWPQGRFPVDKLTKHYGVDEINAAFEDSLSAALSTRWSCSSLRVATA